MQHIVIRQESYVAGTRDRPEVGIFTQIHASRPPVPWGRLGVGDLVYMKWSGGPIVAQARVQRYVEIEHCTAERLRQQTFGYRLHELDDYWRAVGRKGHFFAVAVYLEHERWLDNLITPQARSRGESWIVLVTPELEAGWLGTRPPPPAIEAPARRVVGARDGRSRPRSASRSFGGTRSPASTAVDARPASFSTSTTSCRSSPAGRTTWRTCGRPARSATRGRARGGW